MADDDNPFGRFSTSTPATPSGEGNPFAKWATPEATAPPASAPPKAPEEGYAEGALRGIYRVPYGAAKGLVGDAVGLGQLATAAEEGALGHPSVLGAIGGTRAGQAIKNWAMAPSGSYAESAGNIGGAVAPFLLPSDWVGLPAVAARWWARLPRFARSVAGGAAVGGIQPTEEGTAASHIPGAIGGGLTSLVLSPLGARTAGAAKLTDFNRDAYKYVIGPLEKFGVKVPDTIGREGMNALAAQIQPLLSRTGKVGAAARDAWDRFSHIRSAAREGVVDPDGVLGYFDDLAAARGPQAAGVSPYISNALTELATKAKRAGTPNLYGKTSDAAARTAAHLGGHAAHTVAGVPGYAAYRAIRAAQEALTNRGGTALGTDPTIAGRAARAAARVGAGETADEAFEEKR